MSHLPCCLDVQTIVSYEEILTLESEWSHLEARTPEATGFQSYQWCLSFLEGVKFQGAPLKIRIVAVRENGRLVLLWPLQLETILTIRIVRWLGEPLSQYGDILANSGLQRSVWRQAAEAELARWRDVDLFIFSRVRENSVFVASGLKLFYSDAALTAPFVELNQTIHKGARRHKSLERRFKRLSHFGAVRFEEIDSPLKRLEITRKALDMKRDWLRTRHLFSWALTNPVTLQAFERLVHSGFLRVYCLWAGETIAAIELGFISASVYRSVLGCFNDRLAEGSPGHALTIQLMQRLQDAGVEQYDFLAPSNHYKLIFSNGGTSIGANFVPKTLRGHMSAFAITRLRPSVKRLYASLSTIAPPALSG